MKCSITAAAAAGATSGSLRHDSIIMSGDSECERTDPIRDYCLSAASLVWFFRSMTGNSTTANQEGAMLRSGFEQAYTVGQLSSILIWTFFQPVFWNCPQCEVCVSSCDTVMDWRVFWV